jgi:hypothetical protein
MTQHLPEWFEYIYFGLAFIGIGSILWKCMK